jgi:hypothetical protein
MNTSSSYAGIGGRRKVPKRTKSGKKTAVRGRSDFIDMEMNRAPKAAPKKAAPKKGKR